MSEEYLTLAGAELIAREYELNDPDSNGIRNVREIPPPAREGLNWLEQWRGI